MDIISEKYLLEQKELHKNPDYGVASLTFAPIVAKICKEKGLNIFNCDIHHLKTKKKFDAIFLNDLIEHVASPSVLIKIISELLVSNGRIYICTPNAKALIFQLGKILHFVLSFWKILFGF